jgi:nicotinamidase/pyrazinamidase
VARALLLVDVIKDFLHEDGDRLLESFRERHPALVAAIADARQAGERIVYANDATGTWSSDAPGLVRHAIERGKGGDLVAEVAPRDGDVVVLKRRYSAFDATPLQSILREDLDVTELAIAGTATEMCVFQTATDALRRGFRVSVLAGACATVDPKAEQLALEFLSRVHRVEIVHRADGPFTTRGSSRR